MSDQSLGESNTSDEYVTIKRSILLEFCQECRGKIETHLNLNREIGEALHVEENTDESEIEYSPYESDERSIIEAEIKKEKERNEERMFIENETTRIYNIFLSSIKDDEEALKYLNCNKRLLITKKIIKKLLKLEYCASSKVLRDTVSFEVRKETQGWWLKYLQLLEDKKLLSIVKIGKNGYRLRLNKF